MKREEWEKYLPEFKEKTEAFYAGKIKKAEYKGFSGFYGSYAQRSQDASMLRLRMPAGRVTKEKLAFMADMIRKYHIDCVHVTTCQTVQFHNLKGSEVVELVEAALEAGIVTLGGGGDFPRNVMCSPLSGLQKEEYFDVMPWAEAAGEYLLKFIFAEKMPRKLKVCFSNSPQNIPHATYRDLGFVAREDGTFDVYSAGGLGNNPRFGVKVAENVAPEKILYYIKAMWLTFRAFGNYGNRAKARTRYMQEMLGGEEEYRNAFREKLETVFLSGEDLDLQIEKKENLKKGDGVSVSDQRILAQKQEGLYTVAWHSIGGQPDPEDICRLSDAIMDMKDVELRLSPDQTIYIVNLTGEEAKKILYLTDKGANTVFETSVSCIGSKICQVGLRDSQGLLQKCVEAVRKAGIKDGVLPKIYISGCPSSCGTHQTAIIGFRGSFELIDKKPEPAYVLYVNGCELQGQERFGHEVGTMLEEKIPQFIIELGETIERNGMKFDDWFFKNPEGIDHLAQKYL